VRLSHAIRAGFRAPLPVDVRRDEPRSGEASAMPVVEAIGGRALVSICVKIPGCRRGGACFR
jgi:hypothetical protein